MDVGIDSVPCLSVFTALDTKHFEHFISSVVRSLVSLISADCSKLLLIDTGRVPDIDLLHNCLVIIGSRQCAAWFD